MSINIVNLITKAYFYYKDYFYVICFDYNKKRYYLNYY